MSDASKVSLIELAATAAENASALENALKMDAICPADLEKASLELLHLNLTVLMHLQAMGELSRHGQLLKANRILGQLIAAADLNISLQ